MNRQLTIYVLITTTILVTSSSVHAMRSKPLSIIEKALVIDKIKQEGKATVLKKIENATGPHRVSGRQHGCILFKVPTVLNIETVLHKTESTMAPLAKDIFAKIAQIEAKEGYIPNRIEKRTSDSICITMPTNFLGSSTRYYWLEENGERLPMVRIEANLTNKVDLQKFVAAYEDN